MLRKLALALNKVSPVPSSLRETPSVDAAAEHVRVSLSQLLQHYYFDSFPAGPPAPDPTNFEYLNYLAPTEDFRFLDHVAHASTVKKRALSTEMGQAFCRLALDTHFGIKYFAHMNDVLDKPVHRGFGGIRVARRSKGDVPDYLCARNVTRPLIAEAKGRFSGVSFSSQEFDGWRKQFSRLAVTTQQGTRVKVKGFVVATRFVTESAPRALPTLFIEDPETDGEAYLDEGSARKLGRGIIAQHYARVLRKLELFPLAAALANGGNLTSELRFRVPVWRCISPPCAGMEFIGGFYRTRPGPIPQMGSRGWEFSGELGQGHAVFVGLKRSIATSLGTAARNHLEALDNLPELRPEGFWSSEFSWLSDGTVLAPIHYFEPIGVETL